MSRECAAAKHSAEEQRLLLVQRNDVHAAEMRECLKRLEESGKALDAAREEARQAHSTAGTAEAKVNCALLCSFLSVLPQNNTVPLCRFAC